jgi:hypothetical protein
MRRFRYTLIAVCLVLVFLGGNDLLIWLDNQEPLLVPIGALEASPTQRDWLQVINGYQDLDRAISTSGTVEMDALLVPLLSSPDQQQIRVLIETRENGLLKIFREYHFLTDTLPEKQQFRSKHAADFKGQRNVTGMLVSGLIARGNRQKLVELARQTSLDIADDVILLSEGKTPAKWRGVFFTVIGLLGLIRVIITPKSKVSGNQL